MLNTDPGIRTNNIIQTQFLKSSSTNERMTNEDWEKAKAEKERVVDVIKQKLDASPLIEHWTYGRNPVGVGNGNFKFKKPGGEFEEFSTITVSAEWMNLFDIQLTEGEPVEEYKNRDYVLYISESAKNYSA